VPWLWWLPKQVKCQVFVQPAACQQVDADFKATATKPCALAVDESSWPTLGDAEDDATPWHCPLLGSYD
jgi:hypothetical protein